MPRFAVWSMLADDAVVESLSGLGFDLIIVDEQHGQYTDADTRRAVVAARGGVPVFVRVAGNSPVLIGRALDAGAVGVIVPLVDVAESARAAVDAARYPPSGSRSYGPASLYRGGLATPVDEANSSVSVGVMIETARGLAEVTQIAAVHGVNFLFVGPLDLAIGLGTTVADLVSDTSSGAPLRRIVSAAHDAGIEAGVFCPSDPDLCEAFLRLGFDFVSIGVDAQLMRQGATALLERARAAATGALG